MAFPKITLKRAALGLFIAAGVGGLIYAIVVAVKVKTSTFPSDAPTGGMYVRAQRTSDSKWQVLYLTSTTTNAATFYVVYNPNTSSDPTMTTFDTSAAAQVYAISRYDNDKPTKKFSPVSTALATTLYSAFDKVTII